MLYMSGEQQNIMTEKVGVSKQTDEPLGRRGVVGQTPRGEEMSTRPELINKVLRTIDKLLEKCWRARTTRISTGWATNSQNSPP